MKVLFVCLGNICRSPTADGILRARAPHWEVDSAGTGAWHVGQPPDARAQATARARGIDLSGLRARQVRAEDFTTFDRIYAMDRANLSDLRAMAPAGTSADLGLLLDLVPETGVSEVPDPYYHDGFDAVFDLIDAACARLVEGAAD